MTELNAYARKRLDRLPPCPPIREYRSLQARIGEVLPAITTSRTPAALAARLRGLARVLPPHLMPYAPAADGGDPGQCAEALRFLDVLLLDACVRAVPGVARDYLRRAYKLADAALQYNQTTDSARMVPVLAWVRHFLRQTGRTAAAYADVGCALAAGAPALLMAARILRPAGVVGLIHGTDIVPPPPGLRLSLWREHGVGVYPSDSVRRPLPRRYDVIMLANVHRHLDHALQWRLLANLTASLNQRGLLFVAWRFSDDRHPCIGLERRDGGLALVSDVNLVKQ